MVSSSRPSSPIHNVFHRPQPSVSPSPPHQSSHFLSPSDIDTIFANLHRTISHLTIQNHSLRHLLSLANPSSSSSCPTATNSVLDPHLLHPIGNPSAPIPDSVLLPVDSSSPGHSSFEFIHSSSPSSSPTSGHNSCPLSLSPVHSIPLSPPSPFLTTNLSMSPSSSSSVPISCHRAVHATDLISSPHPIPSLIHDSSFESMSPLRALCQDLLRLIWTSSRPLIILESHKQAIANSSISIDKASINDEDEEITDPVPLVPSEPTPDEVAQIMRSAEDRVLRLSDQFMSAQSDRDILRAHIQSYYQHMAVDRIIRRDNLVRTSTSGGQTSSNAAAKASSNDSGGGGGGLVSNPVSPPVIPAEPLMTPLEVGSSSFRVGSLGIRGGEIPELNDVGVFGRYSDIFSMNGKYCTGAMCQELDPESMMQFMCVQDMEI